jgi:hypothetical protein
VDTSRFISIPGYTRPEVDRSISAYEEAQWLADFRIDLYRKAYLDLRITRTGQDTFSYFSVSSDIRPDFQILSLIEAGRPFIPPAFRRTTVPANVPFVLSRTKSYPDDTRQTWTDTLLLAPDEVRQIEIVY